MLLLYRFFFAVVQAWSRHLLTPIKLVSKIPKGPRTWSFASPAGILTATDSPPAKERSTAIMDHETCLAIPCHPPFVHAGTVLAPNLLAVANHFLVLKMCATLLMCSTMTTPTTRRITSTVLVELAVPALRAQPSRSSPLTVRPLGLSLIPLSWFTDTPCRC